MATELAILKRWNWPDRLTSLKFFFVCFVFVFQSDLRLVNASLASTCRGELALLANSVRIG